MKIKYKIPLPFFLLFLLLTAQVSAQTAPPYQIPVIPTADSYKNVVYIDPTGANGNGTIQAPFNTFEGLHILPNTAYLIRRGTVLNESLSRLWNRNFVGGYGDGAKPILNRGLGISGGSDDSVFRGLDIRRAGTGTTDQVLKFDHSPRPNRITIAYCRIIGMNTGEGYPYNTIEHGANNLVFFHNEVAYCRNNGWWLNGRNIKIVRNWFHNINKDGETSTSSTGDIIQSIYDLTGAHIAGNIFDKSNSMWKYALMLNLGGGQGTVSNNIVAEYNTFYAPKRGAGGAAVRWVPGTNARFSRNVIRCIGLVTPFDTWSQFANQTAPNGIRDNHILVEQGDSIVAFNRATLDASNLIFHTVETHQQYLTSNPHVGLFGSDIDRNTFWLHPLGEQGELQDPPSTPHSLTVTPVSSRRIQLSWVSGSSNTAQIEIQRRTGSGEFVTIADIHGGIGGYTDANLQTETNYSYRIRGSNLAGESAWTSELQATTPPFDTSSRVEDALIALYTFEEGSGINIRDTSGIGESLDLTISSGNVSWLGSRNGISIKSAPKIESSGPATKLNAAITASGAITLEAWFRPLNTSQTGPARIFGASGDSSNRNFLLGQSGSQISARLRTSTTNNNGMPDVSGGTLGTTSETHVVLTWDGVTVHVYQDGALATSASRGGTISNWNANYPLRLANESTGDRHWLGEIYLIAVYDRALSASEIEVNHSIGSRVQPSEPVPLSPTHWLWLEADNNGWAHTHDFLGRLNIREAPWIYSNTSDKWFYLNEAAETDTGAWIFVPAR